MPSHVTYPQATHTWVRHIQEKDEEEIEEDMALAEVDSGDHSLRLPINYNGRHHRPFYVEEQKIKKSNVL